MASDWMRAHVIAWSTLRINREISKEEIVEFEWRRDELRLSGYISLVRLAELFVKSCGIQANESHGIELPSAF
jgi:hypothetical protein